MRIAFVFLSNNQHIFNRLGYFLNRGHEIYYLGLTHSGNQPLPEGVKYIYVKSNQLLSKNKLLKPFHIFHKAQAIWKITRMYDFDILHFKWLPYCVNAVFSRSKKKVFEIAGSDILIIPKRSWIWRQLYKILFRYADAVIQDSKIAQEAGCQYGAPLKNNEIIDPGVDFSIFNCTIKKGIARNWLGIGESQKLIFSPRCFFDLYNIDIIIKTIPVVRKQYSDVKYVFCNHDGNLREKYEKLVDNLGVRKNVIFTGYLDCKKEIPYFYRDADVVVSVPSSDSSPASIYEAIACKTPVVISELPWYHNKFRKDREICVVPSLNIEQLALSILGILKKEIQIDVESAYKKVFESMNRAIGCQKLETLYERLLKD